MTLTNNQTESLLSKGLVRPPDDFHDQVMLQIAEHEKAINQGVQTNAPTSRSYTPGISWWQWLILLPGSVIGVSQMMRFVFSMWIATAAG